MKAVVAAFNQEKALVGAFSVITNLRMELFQALENTEQLGMVGCWEARTIGNISMAMSKLMSGNLWQCARP